MCRRSEEHTSELQSRQYLVCRLLLEKKKKNKISTIIIKNSKSLHPKNKEIEQIYSVKTYLLLTIIYIIISMTHQKYKYRTNHHSCSNTRAESAIDVV